MSLYWIALGVGVLFLGAFFSYGKFLSRHLDLNTCRKTPACEVNDGIDFVPTEKKFLLGQHFSAIAAAGPIVGPILAGLWFGWLPVLLWIVGGSIFFGAVHDFSSLAISVRHKANSIVEIAGEHLGRRAYLLFLGFVWLSLIYVITAFTDLTSNSFVDPELGGGVATSSVAYLLIGVAMGFCLSRLKMSVGLATLIFLPLVGLSIWFGRYIPLIIPANAWLSSQQMWNIILLGYCFVASIIPVQVLLQPRGYLGGYFLYITLALGVLGLFIGGETVQYPAFIGFTGSNGMPLFPLLFVTVACGACSGFHGIVCSGTTSKQIAKETDCHTVGYGAMLLEGLVAIIALSTVMILSRGDALVGASPDRIYAEGLSRFVQSCGLPREFVRSFVLLAFTTFIYDTLDVATRLARYILQELTGWKHAAGRIVSTLLTLLIPLICVSIRVMDASGKQIPAWKLFWTVFGTSNQLLAALTMMILSIWLFKLKKPFWVTAVPAMLMFIFTVWSLFILMKANWIGLIALFLLVLAILLVFEASKTILQLNKSSR